MIKRSSKRSSAVVTGLPRVTKRPMEHSNYGVDKAKNGYVARVNGWIPSRKDKQGRSVCGTEKHFNDLYICKSKAQAKEILKRAAK